ncbi:MAG: fibronectin type protein, partial [Bacteroidetes bacterium]|nr:fibronectin type protein [Bacteroidota bacterium]
PDMWFDSTTQALIASCAGRTTCGEPNATNNPGPGRMTFYWTNQQSARLLFYRDQTYGITRLNVYAGEEAIYQIRDDAEAALERAGLIPGPEDTRPLVIQDKTFVPDTPRLKVTDPTWDTAKWGDFGNLWYPHVYVVNQDPFAVDGANPVGRWDYGPWFWPIFPASYGEVDNPAYDPASAPWEPQKLPGTPNPSGVPEAFMDTPVVNGVAYPFLDVGPRRYRFRILNAGSDRSLNLSLWLADSDVAPGCATCATNSEVKMVPFTLAQHAITPFPAWWFSPDQPLPFDHRVGGVPDPGSRGPAMIQVGADGGVLPSPVVIRNQPIHHKQNARTETNNVLKKALLLGPGERADIVVDFTNFAGKTLILYNDAPALLPMGDPRVDYFTGDADQTGSGGAPPTRPGFGPNTRTIMQIRVTGSGGTAPVDDFNADYLTALEASLASAFSASQPGFIIPRGTFVGISGETVEFPDGTVASVSLDNAGSGYSAAPTVTIDPPPSGTRATAVATLAPGSVGGFIVTRGGSYATAPSVKISGGGGAGAEAAAVLAPRSVASVTVTDGGGKYASVPEVIFSAPPFGTRAAGYAVVFLKQVKSVIVTNPGSGYVKPPTVSFQGGGGTGAAAKANLAPAPVQDLILTAGGSGYTSRPGVTFSGNGGAAASALLSASVGGVRLTDPGSGYTSEPAVTFSGPVAGGTSARGSSSLRMLILNIRGKAIAEEFTFDYGRMNSRLGVEVPFSTSQIQTTILYGYVDPPIEIFVDTGSATGTRLPDENVQVWRITHNGVDTHPLHFPQMDVQVINRVRWDGGVVPPDDNEMGWKDTVRFNPLEDTVVALRTKKQSLPWDLPNSVRLLDVTQPEGSVLLPGPVADPLGLPVSFVTNRLVNFGYEYGWDCQLVSHRDNDSLRPLILASGPKPPRSVLAEWDTKTRAVTLSWVDDSVNETGFRLERATDPAGLWTPISINRDGVAGGRGYTLRSLDPDVAKGTYYYRVVAINEVGYTQNGSDQAGAFPFIRAESAPVLTSVVVK